MRWMYAEPQYSRLVQQYVPRPFPCKLVLVRGEELPAEYTARWATLAGKEFCVHNISWESVYHIDVADNARIVNRWGDLLRVHLDRNSVCGNLDFGALPHQVPEPLDLPLIGNDPQVIGVERQV